MCRYIDDEVQKRKAPPPTELRDQMKWNESEKLTLGIVMGRLKYGYRFECGWKTDCSLQALVRHSLNSGHKAKSIRNDWRGESRMPKRK